ncbi:hypothetical protein BHU72_07015 [Desulfuribacillus stibiiarsenatis]|uniref:Uncharacterized protein n=2 Tax=Desulfuribacillus stibiiarsenatis TaxID=1390249 RepID=A0A1E5L493_9FIRM|nr:hypothetical protein BHU72_07015 [Desulfuribacillus stibiiarsenatis]
MTVGNAMKRTGFTRFWALLSTASIFITSFIFIIDSLHIIEAKEASNSQIEEITNGVNENLDSDSMSNSDQSSSDNGQQGPNENANPTNIADQTGKSGKVSQIMLLDLFAKRFTGDLSGMSAVQKEWLLKQLHLYPADSKQKLTEVEKLAIPMSKQGELLRNINNYKQKIIKDTGTVLETLVDEGTAIREMQIQVLTTDGVICILYYPAVVEVQKGERIQFYGTPIAYNSKSSDLFGSTDTILVYANHITR